MKFLHKYLTLRNIAAGAFLMMATLVSAQGDEQMSIKLAKTAIEKYGDFEQAEKYLNSISPGSPYRDSVEFLLIDGKVNTAIGDKSKTPKPENYQRAIEDFERLYFITNDSSLSDLLTDLKYKYDKAKARELTKLNEISTAHKDSARIDSIIQAKRGPIKRFANFPDGVFHNPTWHVGINLGLSFDYFNYAATLLTHSETTIGSNIIDSANTMVSKYQNCPGIGLKFGLACHPYISDIVAVGVHADGEVGTTHLIFAGGGSSSRGPKEGFSKNTNYLYGNFNYGLEVSAGWHWIKFLGAYDHSLRHTDLSYFEDSYYFTSDNAGIKRFTQVNSRYKLKTEFRHEEITCGLRIFPYSKDKLHIKNPCILDLAYTVNRDYNFGWNEGGWSYNSINNFYHGFKVKLWVESVLGISLNVSFPDNYFKVRDELSEIKTDKTLPFIGLSLYYNKDFFGKRY